MKIYGRKGFTLIELVVTMAILGIVVGAIYSILAFGNNSFSIGNKQYNIQSGTRLAVDAITREVRYATSLSILPVSDCEAQIASNSAFNYIYVKNGTIYQSTYDYTTDTHTIRRLSENVSSTGTAFSKIDDETLGIAITEQDGSKSFSVNSKINMKNFSLLSATLDNAVGPGDPMLAIKYGKSAPASQAIIISGAAGTVTGTIQLTSSYHPVVWMVDNTSLATIDNTGKLTPIANGQVVVTALASDGSGAIGTLTLTITGQVVIPVTSVAVTSPASSITDLNGSMQMTATVAPANATYKTVIWSVDNPAVAAIDSSGKLIAASNGTVVVTATATYQSAISGSKTISVSGQPIKVANIIVSSSSGTITSPNGTMQMSAAVTPGNAANKVVSWSVDNTTVATIDNTGKLTAKNNGQVVVTATATDGSGIKGTKVITISGQPVLITSMTISGDSSITSYKGSFQFNIDIQPPNASNNNVKWSVDKNSIAGVSSNGKLTAVGDTHDSDVIVTAQTQDGSGITATYTVSVTGQFVYANSITVKGTGDVTTIDRKSNLQMLANFDPSNASNKNVNWKVSDVAGNATNIATISGSGLLMPNGGNNTGTVRVTATAVERDKNNNILTGYVDIVITKN